MQCVCAVSKPPLSLPPHPPPPLAHVQFYLSVLFIHDLADSAWALLLPLTLYFNDLRINRYRRPCFVSAHVYGPAFNIWNGKFIWTKQFQFTLVGTSLWTSKTYIIRVSKGRQSGCGLPVLPNVSVMNDRLGQILTSVLPTEVVFESPHEATAVGGSSVCTGGCCQI